MINLLEGTTAIWKQLTFIEEKCLHLEELVFEAMKVDIFDKTVMETIE